jgi:hypothetical protein
MNHLNQDSPVRGCARRPLAVVKALLLALALATMCLSGTAYAGFDWGSDKCAAGEGDCTQDIAHSKTVDVGIIPKGKAGVRIDLTSPVDVDVQLIDVETGHALIAWPSGDLNGAGESCTDYQGVTYCYSGYNGVNGNQGNEFIEIKGTTNREMKMRAFGYQAGEALVDYSWKANDDCVDSGSGSFKQDLEQSKLALVGVIPTGKQDVVVNLKSDKDIDIVIHDDETGMVVVAWACSSKPNHVANCLDSSVPASVQYEGMTIEYSGWNGIGGKAGHESIKVKGKLTRDLKVLAFAYQPGEADVTYTWGPQGDSVDPKSTCASDHIEWDEAQKMCVVTPAFVASKDECETTQLPAMTTTTTTCQEDLSKTNQAANDLVVSLEACKAEFPALTTALGAAKLAQDQASVEHADAQSVIDSFKSQTETCKADVETCNDELAAAKIALPPTGCTELPAPPGGQATFIAKGFNSTQTFTCGSGGLTLTGASTLECVPKAMNSGVQHLAADVKFGWNAPAPTCN